MPQFASNVDQAQVAKALSQLQGNPGLVNALQHKLDDLVGMSSGFVESLHYKVRARVNALTTLQESHDELYEKYLDEKRALEAKYRDLYAPLYVKRAGIVKGAEDVDATPGEDDDETEEAPVGIPDFWLCALRNHEIFEQQITEKDEPALKFLNDITCTPLQDLPVDEKKKEEEDDDDEEEEEDDEPQRGFRLDFHFDENPYFSNEVLSKSYHMVDEEDPILESAEGTDIEWAQGKNLCVKVLRKKPKKGDKKGKPITKTEKADSFFNFFSPPDVPGEGDDLTEEEAEQLQDFMEMDYEMGAIIKEKIIPDAISWFTGEAKQDEDDSDYDDEDDDDESEDFDEDDEDDDSDDDAPARGRGRGKAKSKAPAGADDGEKPPECKQQ